MSEHYETALAEWKESGGVRPHGSPDGVLTRFNMEWLTLAELLITGAIRTVENAGASEKLTRAITLLQEARGCVADHVEGFSY